MKQFICIRGEHYSVEGILAIYNVKTRAKDILPEMVAYAVETIGDMENNNHPVRISSVKFDNLDAYGLQIVHAAEADPLVVPLERTIIKTGEDSLRLQNYVVTKIAQSQEPILELGDILEEAYRAVSGSLVTEEQHL